MKGQYHDLPAGAETERGRTVGREYAEHHKGVRALLALLGPRFHLPTHEALTFTMRTRRRGGRK